MKKKRLIPIVLLRNGWIVQSVSFKEYKNLGNPVFSVKRLSEWCSDELIYLDITQDGAKYDMRRDDIHMMNHSSISEIIENVSNSAFMPLCFGGGIRNIADIEERLRSGADKVSVNRALYKDPEFVKQAAKEFGSQCIIGSVDYVGEGENAKVFNVQTRSATDLNLIDFCKHVEDLGIGEILLNSVERDGLKTGFDIEQIDRISKLVRIPVIACGGCGNWEHLAEVFNKTDADAVAAANIFQHVDQSTYLAKEHLFQQGHNVRKPDFVEL